MTELTTALANGNIHQFEVDKAVCPPNLHVNVFLRLQQWTILIKIHRQPVQKIHFMELHFMELQYLCFGILNKLMKDVADMYTLVVLTLSVISCYSYLHCMLVFHQHCCLVIVICQ